MIKDYDIYRDNMFIANIRACKYEITKMDTCYVIEFLNENDVRVATVASMNTPKIESRNQSDFMFNVYTGGN